MMRMAKKKTQKMSDFIAEYLPDGYEIIGGSPPVHAKKKSAPSGGGNTAKEGVSDVNNAGKNAEAVTVVMRGNKWKVVTKVADNDANKVYLRLDRPKQDPIEYKQGEIVTFNANGSAQKFDFEGVDLVKKMIKIKKNGGALEELRVVDMNAYLTDSFTFSAQSGSMFGDYYDEYNDVAGIDGVGGHGQHYIDGYDHYNNMNGHYVQNIGGSAYNGVDSMQFVYITIIAMFIAVCMCCLCALCSGIGAFVGYWLDNVVQKFDTKENKYAIVNEDVGDESEV